MKENTVITDSTKCTRLLYLLPSSLCQIKNVKIERLIHKLCYSFLLNLCFTVSQQTDFLNFSTKDIEACHCDPAKDIGFPSGTVALRIFKPLSRKCLMH